MAVDSRLNVEVKGTTNVPQTLKTAQSSIIRFVGAVSAATAALKALAFPVASATEFDKTLRDVQKTTEFTDRQISQLSKSLVELSTTLNVTANDLGIIAAKAGQLGLGREGQASIEAFTEATARFSAVLDVSVDSAAEGLARISNIFQLPIAQVEKVSSAFNELSNTSTASGQVLLDIVARLGNAGGLIELADSVALAATAIDLGLTPEVTGTSLTKFFSNMQSKAEEFASVLGISTDQWVAKLQVDGVDALKEILKQLNGLDDVSKALQIRTLFGGGRLFAVANKLLNDASNDFEILNRHIDDGTDAYNEGRSSIDEYETVLKSLSAQATILGNTITGVGIQVGEGLLPPLVTATKDLQEFFKSDEVVQFSLELGNSFESLIGFIVDLGKAVTSMDVEWSNVINTFQLLIGLGIAKLFLSLGRSIVGFALSAGTATASFSGIGTAIVRFIAGTAAAEKKMEQTGQAAVSLGERVQIAGEKIRKAAAAAPGAARDAVTSGDTSIIQKRIVLLEQEKIRRKAILVEQNLLLDSTQRQIEKDRIRAASLTTRGGARTKALRKVELAEKNLAIARKKNEASYYRGLRVVNGELRKQSAILNGITAKSVLLGRSFRGLLGAVRGFAGLLARIFLNPIGLAITAITLFGDKIASFFGFVDKEQARLARDAAITTRKLLEEREKLISTFTTTNSQAAGGDFTVRKVEVDTTLATGGIKALEEATSRAIDNLALLQRSFDGAGLQAQDFENANVRLTGELDDTIDRIQKVRKELDTAMNINALDEDLFSDDEIKSLSSELAKLVTLQTALESKIRMSEDAYDSTIDKVAKLGLALEAQAEQVAMALPLGTEGAIDILKPFIELKKELVTTEASLEKVKDKLKSLVDTADDDAESKVRDALVLQQNLIDKRALAIVQLDNLINKAGESPANATAFNSLTKTLTDLARNANVSVRFLDLLSEKIDENGKSAAENTEITTELLRKKLIESATYEKLVKGATAYDDAIQKTAKSIKGSYDNLSKSVLKLRNDTEKSLAGISRALQERKFSIEIQINSEKLDRELQLTLDDLEKLFKIRVAELRLPEGSRRDSAIANIREQIDADKDLATIQAENRKNEAKAKDLVNKRDRAGGRFLEDQAKLLADLNTLRKESEAIAAKGVDATQEERKSIIDQSAALNARATALRDSAKIVTDLNTQIASSEDLVIHFGFDNREIKSAFDGVRTASGDFLQDSGGLVASKILEAESQVRKTTNEIAEITAKASGDFASGLKTNLADTNKFLGELGKNLGINAEQISSLKTAFDGFTAPAQKLADSMTEVSESLAGGLTPDTEFGFSASNISEALKAAVLSSEGELGTDFTRIFSLALKQIDENSFGIDPTKLAGNIRTALEVAKVSITPDTVFDGLQVKESLAKAVDNVPLTVDIKGRVTLANKDGGIIDTGKIRGVSAFAGGGDVSGAGTGTSDSILSWLSNGEYVIDAATTRRFGSGFFESIQRAARAGSTMGLRIPRFATGGLVSEAPGVIGSTSPSSGTIGASESVELTLNLAGETFKVAGARDQVKGLVSAFKKVGRGLVK